MSSFIVPYQSDVSEPCGNVPDEPEEAVTDDFDEDLDEEEEMEQSMGFTMSM